MRTNLILILLLGIALALLSACSGSPATVGTPTAATKVVAPVSIPTVTPTLETSSPFQVSSAQLARLGPPTTPFVESRQVILQRFVHGVMFIFAKSDDGFGSGSEYVFALASDTPKDAQAWRSADTFVETSKMADNWYTCERAPGLRPEKSGIPWRGFGKVWCDHQEIRSALGNAASYEEADINASFQDYARGRAFQLAEWRGIPGWSEKQAYVIYLDTDNRDFASGHWEEAER